MDDLIGKYVTLYIGKESKISGKLSKTSNSYYQVTQDYNKYYVFSEREISGIINNNLFHNFYFED